MVYDQHQPQTRLGGSPSMVSKVSGIRIFRQDRAAAIVSSPDASATRRTPLHPGPPRHQRRHRGLCSVW